MITRQQACDLFKYDFKLVDKEGNIFSIASVTRNDTLSLFIDEDTDWKPILFSRIGTDFFILAHHHSCLTKQINGVIPFLELENEFRLSGFLTDLEFDVKGGYALFSNDSVGSYHGVPAAFFEKLYQMHFLPHGIEESNVKYIND